MTKCGLPVLRFSEPKLKDENPLIYTQDYGRQGTTGTGTSTAMEDLCGLPAVALRRLDVLCGQLAAESDIDQRTCRTAFATANQSGMGSVAKGPAVIIGGSVLDIQVRAADASHQMAHPPSMVLPIPLPHQTPMAREDYEARSRAHRQSIASMHAPCRLSPGPWTLPGGPPSLGR